MSGLDKLLITHIYLFKKLFFIYALAIFIFRTGVRRNNSELIQTSCVKFAPLSSLMHCPKDVEIMLRQSIIRATCPQSVCDFLVCNESFSNSNKLTLNCIAWVPFLFIFYSFFARTPLYFLP